MIVGSTLPIDSALRRAPCHRDPLILFAGLLLHNSDHDKEEACSYRYCLRPKGCDTVPDKESGQ